MNLWQLEAELQKIINLYFSPFAVLFGTDVLKMAPGRPCIPVFWMFTHWFVMKIHVRAKNCKLCHVYNTSNCFEIVSNVTWQINVAAINGHDWQPPWILRYLLKSELILVNFLGLIILKYMFRGKNCKSKTNWSCNRKIIILAFRNFP